MKKEFTYKNIPPLAKYIDRIGAEQLNFRKFIIKSYHGNYYIERSMITLDAEGKVNASNKEHEPTDKEQEAITHAFKEVSFPKQIKTDKLVSLKKALGAKADYHVFYANDRKNIIMAQQKIIDKTGMKRYIPWCFFDDGQWRKLEPDNKLPFWKPHKDRGMHKIMIHEGAKAASFIDDLVNNPKRKKELKNHPFGEDLKQYEHWGMIGGALAPHRTDYTELKQLKSKMVVYVCDNDTVGIDALQVVSENYGMSMRGVVFGDNWPEAWDLADEMPQEFFDDKALYCGQSFKSLMRPATWATETKEFFVDGASKKKKVVRADFKKEWVHCISPEVYIFVDEPDKLYTTSQFNHVVAPFSHVDDTSRLMRKSEGRKVSALDYDPSLPSGIYSKMIETDQFKFNTHLKSVVKPVKKSVKPFLDYMKFLIINDDDRHNLLKWCATLIACPEIKMSYGVLMISNMQGVGKSTLGEAILAPILGKHNVSFASEEQIVNGAFNEWQAHKRLAICHEIYAGNSHKAYNKLKSIITDEALTINKKFHSEYTIKNWLHMFACSNSMKALKLENDDRRWLVPLITETKKDKTYWKKFYTWLEKENGLGAIVNWAYEFVEEHGNIERGEHAPDGVWKKEVIKDGMNEDQALVNDYLESLIQESQNEPFLIGDKTLVNFVKNRNYDGRRSTMLMKPLTARKIAKDLGLFICEATTNHYEKWGIFQDRTTFITNDFSLSKMHFQEILQKNIQPKRIEENANNVF
jgi:hypothetical protein